MWMCSQEKEGLMKLCASIFFQLSTISFFVISGKYMLSLYTDASTQRMVMVMVMAASTVAACG